MIQKSNSDSHLSSALLDAWQRKDVRQIEQVAAEARMLSERHAADPTESERIELLEGIAIQLQKLIAVPGNARPYLDLLTHLTGLSPA